METLFYILHKMYWRKWIHLFSFRSKESLQNILYLKNLFSNLRRTCLNMSKNHILKNLFPILKNLIKYLINEKFMNVSKIVPHIIWKYMLSIFLQQQFFTNDWSFWKSKRFEVKHNSECSSITSVYFRQ